MNKRNSLGFLLAATLLPGCLNLDIFVFRNPAAKPGETMLEDARVPERLRELHVGVPGNENVSVYLASHDGGDGDVAADPARKSIVVFYCHGQSNHIGKVHARIEELWRLGYTVAAVDPRGYGKSPGTPTQQGVVADLVAARTYVESRTDLGIDPARFAIYGRSLGSAFCLSLLHDRPVPAVVLESPIGSLQSMVNDSLSIEAPGEWFFDSSFDNFETIKLHTGPLLVMHGDADDFVQPKYGRQVSDNANGHATPNTFWSAPGADHGSVPCVDRTRGLDETKDADVRHDACPGGFDPVYLQQVTETLDRLKPTNG